MKTKRSITITQVKSLYVTMREAYINSSSMMIDDAFNGVKPKAAKMGILCCYDCGWFQEMFRFVRAYRTWESFTSTQIETFKYLVNNDRI